MNSKTRDLMTLALVGLIAGFLASLIVGGGGLIRCLISGVVGAFVGSWLLDKLGVSLGLKNELAARIVTATIGAVVVLIMARLLN